MTEMATLTFDRWLQDLRTATEAVQAIRTLVITEEVPSHVVKDKLITARILSGRTKRDITRFLNEHLTSDWTIGPEVIE